MTVTLFLGGFLVGYLGGAATVLAVIWWLATPILAKYREPE